MTMNLETSGDLKNCRLFEELAIGQEKVRLLADKTLSTTADWTLRARQEDVQME
ncbi:unnamed protein product [Strongylus vulgaris]|uniref:Uncharacterized protein n=1 Tax=Strongylus vulgaris TaxID=40348 RepID=A0A3P7ILI8_STRVU|nr:unnamed protein product [Strongylus vulgaris]